MHMYDNPTDWIRSNAPRFFLRGQYDGGELCGMLVAQAHLLGARRTVVQRLSSWWIVSADIDWLPPQDAHGVPSAFTRITPLPDGGANSLFCEILATSFAAAVVTGTAGDCFVVLGDDTVPPEVVTAARLDGTGRFIAFR